MPIIEPPVVSLGPVFGAKAHSCSGKIISSLKKNSQANFTILPFLARKESAAYELLAMEAYEL